MQNQKLLCCVYIKRQNSRERKNTNVRQGLEAISIVRPFVARGTCDIFTCVAGGETTSIQQVFWRKYIQVHLASTLLAFISTLHRSHFAQKVSFCSLIVIVSAVISFESPWHVIVLLCSPFILVVIDIPQFLSLDQSQQQLYPANMKQYFAHHGEYTIIIHS